MAALGPEAESRLTVTVPVTERIMGQVAAQRRPLLVVDVDLDPRYSCLPDAPPIAPAVSWWCALSASKFWGVLNFADREDHQPFTARDLFWAGSWGVSWWTSWSHGSVKGWESWRPDSVPAVVEHLRLGVALLDQELKVVQANPALERLIDRSAGGGAGQALIPNLGLAAGDQEMLETAFRELLADQEPREYAPLRSSLNGGPVRFLGVKMLPSLAGPENPQGFLLVEDLTEVEQLRQRLHLYEHLAIMGRLSLCVAHELNNPLDGVRRYLSLAQVKKDDPGEVERYLIEAQKGLQKMALTIRALLSSANPLKAPRSTDNLLNLLQDAVKIMMFQASDQRVQVSCHLPPEFQRITVDGDLYHVFINVIKNALQAMPQEEISG